MWIIPLAVSSCLSFEVFRCLFWCQYNSSAGWAMTVAMIQLCVCPSVNGFSGKSHAGFFVSGCLVFPSSLYMGWPEVRADITTLNKCWAVPSVYYHCTASSSLHKKLLFMVEVMSFLCLWPLHISDDYNRSRVSIVVIYLSMINFTITKVPG